MRIQQYIDGMVEAIQKQFPDPDRQMSMADVGRLFGAAHLYSSQHRDLPMLPYDAENGVTADEET